MSTNRRRNIQISVILILGCFLAAHLLTLLFANIFTSWNSRAIDQLFLFRSDSIHFRPYYNDTIVHVDLNNTSIQQFNQFYFNRSHHAKAISNLSAMKAAALLYDFIFAAPSNEIEDRALVEVVSKAGNVYFGLAFELARSGQKIKESIHSQYLEQYLAKTKWKVTTSDDPSYFYQGVNPLITFPALSAVSRGLGFLNIKPDRDGVFRRTPLLVKYADGYYPSLPFKVICEYFGVSPENIIIHPGKSITLKDARKPGTSNRNDIIIPIDRHGNLIINFVGPWERMKHYNFSDVLRASEDRDELELWAQELAGKIVVVSEVTTGSSDVGPVPTDSDYPLSGVSANVLHTILTQSFLKELSGLEMVFIELMLMLIILILALRSSSVSFSIGTVAVAGGYLGLTAFFFLYGNVILNIVRPLLMITFTLIALQINRAIAGARAFAETEKARKIAEHELEIGRQIQAGFFPEIMPVRQNWEIAAYFKPARQVAGDFYDAFTLKNGQQIGIVIADVCDKGVGAALFMALIRSLIRAFAIQNFDAVGSEETSSDPAVADALLKTITLTNNYIAETHSRANMFATVFFGVLDPATGWLNYINGGHEPPIITGRYGNVTLLKPTGAAVGMMPDLTFVPQKIRINPGDVLFAYTDGVSDAQNPNGEFFSKARLLSILSRNTVSAQAVIDNIRTEIDHHIAGAEQFDDITMISIRRKE